MTSGYDIYKNTLDKLKNPYMGSTYTNPYMGKGLTETQQEIKGYADKIQKEPSKIRPLQFIFDLLQRGQYVSANMVDQAFKNSEKDDPLYVEVLDVLKAGGRGLTGEQKGNYKDILVEHIGMEDRAGKIDAVDILGFVGDVFLDPLTYITIPASLVSGATKMGIQGATKYGDDVAKVALKTLGKDFATGNFKGVTKFMTKSFDQKKFLGLVDESLEAGNKYFSKHAGGDVAKSINEIRTVAFKKALHTPAAELREEMLRMTKDLMADAAQKRGEAIGAFAMGSVQPKQLQVLQQPTTMLEDLVKSIPTAYGGAGERKFGTFLGHEFGKSVRDINSLERMGEVLKGGLSKVAGKVGLKDAWWTAMNRGPIGDLRRKLNFHDPYGKMLNLEYMDNGVHYGLAQMREETLKAHNVIEGVDDVIQQKWVQAVIIAEDKTRKTKMKVTPWDLLKDPVEKERLRISDEELQQVEAFGSSLTDYIRTSWAEYMKEAQTGTVDTMNQIINYLPVTMKDPNVKSAKLFNMLGTSSPGFTKTKSFATVDTIQQQVAKYKAILGVDDSTAHMMIKEMNLSEVNLNVEQMLTMRGYAMAQVKKRGNIIRTFREYGVPIDDVKDSFGEGLLRPGGRISEMGLASSSEKGLEGLLFDKEVMEVFNRVVSETSPSKVGSIQKLFINYNSWWKGMATMTTGFHARNFLSNNVTGWMVHGTKWMNPKKDLEALAGSIHAGRVVDVKKALKEVNMPEGAYKKLLNTRHGDYTLKELADMQIEKGLLSEAQMGFDPKDIFRPKKKFGAIDPFSEDFVGKKASRKLGGWIENQSKFKSFLIDYDELYKEAGKLAPDVARVSREEALLTAERTAKKWWLDYSDLSGFEQKVMKNVLPFYCWMRKNIGNQLEGLLLYPQTFSIFPKVIDAMAYDDPDFDPDSIPEWMSDLGMFPTSVGFGEEKTLFRPDMPFMDLNKLPFIFEEGKVLPKFDKKELIEDVTNAAHPFVKTFASMMTKKGYDFFKKKDLAEDAPAPLFMRFLTKHVDTLENLDGLFRLTGATGFNPKVDEDGKLRINAKYLQFFENNMPIIRNINLIVEGVTSIDGVEEAIEEATGYKDDYEKIEQLFRVIGSLTGVKFYPFDTEESEYRYQQNIWNQATQERSADNRNTPESIFRRESSRENKRDLIRRAFR